MFETAELGRTVDDATFKERSAPLRDRLLGLQYRLRDQKRFAVLIDFAGVDGAGKAATVDLLHGWLDARGLLTRAYDDPTSEERQRPRLWRFWRDLPPHGAIGLRLSGRYSRPFLARVHGTLSQDDFRRELDRLVEFERALALDGALLLKFWMHLDRDAQKARLEKLENDPLQSWRVKPLHWDHYALYDTFVETAEEMLAHTQSELAPWHIVEGVDANYRTLRVTGLIADALEQRLGRSENGEDPPKLLSNGKLKQLDKLPKRPAGLITILSEMDMSPALGRKEYRRQLAEQQQRLALLSRRAHEKGMPTVIVVEGPDAAGKGGALRRMIPGLDARNYQVLQYGAPTDEESQRHYLWRFWRNLGPAGRVTIFDRSWYGRVLVERVLKLASSEEWKRAYAEINDFERQLMDDGAVLLKFWLHITPEEQLRRFVLRGSRPHKRWKLTDEDWRNRKEWFAYEQAAHDMVHYTSTRRAPWHLVPANDKPHARVTLIRIVCDALEQALGKSAPVNE